MEAIVQALNSRDDDSDEEMNEDDDPEEVAEKEAEKAADFVARCQAADVKPINAFWKDYPMYDLYQSFPPDILHQLYQGVLKHLIAWLKVVYGEKVLDARLPDNHQLRLFQGISGLSRVSGAEHQDICRFVLGVIVDAPLKRSLGLEPRALFAPFALDQDGPEDLSRYKQVFKDLKAREHFDFPKMHALAHYYESFRSIGTADKFNTSYSERLHIDFAKSAYRASNRKDEYPQMTTCLQRREQIRTHQSYVEWRLQSRPALEDLPRAPFPRAPKLKRKIVRNANASVSFEKAERLYGADDFEHVLKDYVLKAKHPRLYDRYISNVAKTYTLPFDSVRAFHRIKFWHPDALERDTDLAQELPDSILARPAYRDTQRRKAQGYYSMALGDEFGEGGLEYKGIALEKKAFALVKFG
ncbi:hypothetical protein PENSPDRAFT_682390 [Peniophora sp. CONT]|nr:hypothetical protein PENSPDRAFT_682390 [Peniophora sp. CONT]